MDFTALIGAFGGGVLAAAIGGVPAFIFTGLTVIAAVMGGAAGAPAIGALSFGSVFGPHVAFGGAVAGAAYAKSKNLLEAGADVVTPLFKTGDASVLCVGGVFGIIGFLIQHLLGPLLGGSVFGNAGWTDTVGMTVVVSGILSRLIFTKSGITGKYEGSEPRKYFPEGKRLSFLIVFGIGVGVCFGGLAAVFGNAGLAGDAFAAYLFANTASIAFGIAAAMLMFACAGLPFEGYHHVAITSAATAIAVFSSTMSPIGAIVGAAVMGAIAAVWGEVAGLIFNSYADSHIDPPAVTIFTLQIINFTILPLILPVASEITSMLG